jgi:hypothetical protein
MQAGNPEAIVAFNPVFMGDLLALSLLARQIQGEGDYITVRDCKTQA